ncbi:hypothetical protein P0Y31_01260 [Knoellia sp. 3-2P3]|uniref:hypothetical protein n=1 Tax=unclassified Knoellia TaxID=2618719 RepID=UPI0023DADDCF|nr:hypothetical protein [Knoellia sp. 3-2P3]MDF2090961.1 hypothetical protein [Knoellia sp. 3-2P3]
MWALLAWRVEPRSVGVEQLRDDIASGRILLYRVTGTERSEAPWPPSGTADGWDTLALDETTGLPSRGVNRVPATGIIYWVDAPFAQTRHVDAVQASVPWENLVGELRAGGVPLEAPGIDDPQLYDDVAFWPGWAAIVLGLGSVLTVYRPTRVTRWGWLWFTAVVPLGLGLVALAVGELVRPAGAPGEEHEHRLRGGRAFLLAWALNVLVVVAAGQLSRSLDALWMP